MLRDLDNRSYSIKSATFVNMVAKLANVALNLVFSAWLARILTPEDFGVVAVVTVFTNLFILFSDMGIGIAVIQNKSLTKDDENRIFSFSAILGIVLGSIFAAFCALVLTSVYENPVYGPIGILLGINLFFTTLNMVPNAYQMKHKLFGSNAVRNIVTAAFGYIAEVALALAGARYYAIVAQAVMSSALIVAWNLRIAKLRFDFTDIRVSLQKIWGYSVYQFAFSLVNYFSRNLDNLLAGYYFGEADLGYYDKAYRLLRYPTGMITGVITPSLQPILSDHQDDLKYVFKQYNRIVKFLALVSVYISVICFFASKEIILLYFGDQWIGSVTCFHYLAIGLAFDMTGGVSGSIFQSVNRTKEMFWSGVLGALFMVTGILIGVRYGSIESIAFCYTMGFITNFFKSQFFLAHFCFEKRLSTVLKVYVPEVFIALAMIVVMLFVPTLDNLLASLLLKVAVSLSVYLVACRVTGEDRVLAAILPARIRKHLPDRLQ